MKKVLNIILFSLILSINAIELVDLKQDRVFKFSSDQEAKTSIDYTACLELLKNKEFMDQLKQFIEEEGLPEDYDLNEIALMYCQQISEENEEIQTQTKLLVSKVNTVGVSQTPFYKPRDIKQDIKDFGSTVFLPPSPIEKEEIFKKDGESGWKKFWRKVGEALQQLAIDFLVATLKRWLGMD